LLLWQWHFLPPLVKVNYSTTARNLSRTPAERTQAIPEMLRNLPQDIGQALLNPIGATLATAIRHAAAQARHSAQPLPQDVFCNIQN